MMADEERSDEEEHLDLFKEPEGYYEPEKQHTFVIYKAHNGQTLNLRLVGHNPHWVGRCTSTRSLNCKTQPDLTKLD